MLRSIRYGEADRILHLYTPGHGRVGAIAKGVRRARSRFGARLEPFFHVRADPARGARRAAHGDRRRHGRRARRPARPRRDARRRRARLRRGRAPVRERGAASGGVPPARQRARAARADAAQARPANGLAFRLKLLLAAGILPAAGDVRRVRRDPSTCAASPPPPAASSATPARRRRSRSARSPTGSWSARSAARSREAPGRLPSSRCGRPSARSPRPPSTTPTCGCGRCSRRLSAGRTRVTFARRRPAAVSESMLWRADSLTATYEHPRGPVADALRGADPRARGARPLAAGHPLLSGAARRARAGLRAAHARSSATATGSSTARRSGA